LVIIAEALF
jgi:redox-sensitive bicupin YhaK (pirin superfamily)